MNRSHWQIRKDESKEDFINRTKRQEKQFQETRRIHGSVFMIKFGEGDIRPMYEDQIKMSELIQQIRTPLDTHYDCPLCQPYDNWDGMAEMDQNRRYLCRVIAPKYKNGYIEDTGTCRKCACITKAKYRKYLKFKK